MLRRLLLMSGWLLAFTCWGQAAKSGAGSGNGLTGEYYVGSAFNRKVMVRTEPQIDFSWDGYTLPAPGVPANSFSVRWTGKLYAPVTGPYKFTAVVDDGIRIWVDGKLAMDEWRYRRQKLAGQSVQLQAGHFYDLKIEYYNAKNGGYVQLNWNLVNERSKTPAFDNAPQHKVSAQFLYNGPIARATPPPAGKPKPVPAPIAKPKPAPPVVAVAKKPTVVASKPKIVPLQPLVTKSTAAPPAPPVALPVDESAKAPGLVSVDLTTARQLTFAQSDYQLLPSSYGILDELALTLRRDTTLASPSRATPTTWATPD